MEEVEICCRVTSTDGRYMQRTAMHTAYGEAWLTLLAEVDTYELRLDVPAFVLAAHHSPLAAVEPREHRGTTVGLGAIDGAVHQTVLVGAGGCMVIHIHHTTGMYM